MTKSSPLELNFQLTADQAPLEQNSLFSKIINNVGDELMIIDDNARIVFVNTAAVKGLGYSKKHLLQASLLDFYKEKPSLNKWKHTQLAELKRTQKPISLVLDRVVKGGKCQTIEVTAVYVAYRNQGFILSVARDITQRISLKKQLENAVNQYHSLCEGAGDPIFTLSLDGHITYANLAAEKFLKVSARRLTSKHLKEFVHPKSLAKVWSCFLKVKKTQTQQRLEVNAVDKNHAVIPIEVTVSPLMENDGISSFHVIARDIRQRQQIEQLMRESEKVKAIQYFVSGTAQELTHPLVAIRKQIDNLIKNYKYRDYEFIGYKEFSNIIATLEKTSEQLNYSCQTIDRLTSLSKKKSKIKKKQCDPNKIIEEVVQRYVYQFKVNRIKCHLKLAPKVPSIAILESEFNQIITNVINNSVESMPGGGLLKIKTSQEKSIQRVKIEIEDDGVGVSKSNLPHLFDPFFTTKQRGIGRNSGLGLVIVHSLVNACQGEIKVDSSLTKGTKVRISIPVAKFAKEPSFAKK